MVWVVLDDGTPLEHVLNSCKQAIPEDEMLAKVSKRNLSGIDTWAAIAYLQLACKWVTSLQFRCIGDALNNSILPESIVFRLGVGNANLPIKVPEGV